MYFLLIPSQLKRFIDLVQKKQQIQAFHDKYAYDYNIYGYGKLRKSKRYSRIVNGISFTDLVINDSDRFSLVCGLHQYIHCWHFFKLSDYSDYDVKVKFYTLKKESGDYYNIVLSIEGVNGNLNLLNSYRKFFIIDLIVCYIFLVFYYVIFLHMNLIFIIYIL